MEPSCRALRKQREGLRVGVLQRLRGQRPLLSPELAAKSAMDALAVQYARELSRWGIETTIVVAGAFERGLAISRRGDTRRRGEGCPYEVGPYAGFARQVRQALDSIMPADADPGAVAGAITLVVDTPFGERPFRVHVNPCQDGASVAFAVIDRVPTRC